MAPPEGAKPPTAEEAFRRRCFLNAVTDPAAVDALWAAEKARLESASAGAKAAAREKAKAGRRVGRGRRP